MNDQHITNHLLLWFDLETTGLDENNEAILEVGWGISDLSLNWLVEPMSYPISHDLRVTELLDVVGPVRKLIWVDEKPVDQFVADMHIMSGLWKDLTEGASVSLKVAEDAILVVLDVHSNGGKVSMAGSGVSQFDMRWIARHMPRLHSYLTYYSIDLGTYERVDSVLRGGGIRPSRNAAAHRAVDDILYSHELAQNLKRFLLTGVDFDRE